MGGEMELGETGIQEVAESNEPVRQPRGLAEVIVGAGVSLHESDSGLLGDCVACGSKGSLSIDPDGLGWSCCRCGGTGGAVEWVMAAVKVSRHHAVELLRAGAEIVPSGNKVRTTPYLSCPVDADASDAVVLEQIADFYAETASGSSDAQRVLDHLGITSAVATAHRIGWANRTLGLRIPSRTRVEGAKIRERLTGLGIYRPTGREHLAGCLVIPCAGSGGTIAQFYGHRFLHGVTQSTHKKVWLPNRSTGVFVAGTPSADGEAVLVASPLIAVILHSAGTDCAISFYPDDLSAEGIIDSIGSQSVQRLVVALDPERCGKVAASIASQGIEVAACIAPPGLSADGYAQAIAASRVLPARIVAPRMSASVGIDPAANRRLELHPEDSVSAMAVARHLLPDDEVDRSDRALGEIDFPLPPEMSITNSESVGDATSGADPAEAPCVEAHVSTVEGDLHVEVADRHWRVRGLSAATSPCALKVNLLVRRGARYHVDSLDLFSARGRTGFVAAASRELRVSPEVVKADLGKVLMTSESTAAEFVEAALAPPSPPAYEMSDEENRRALEYLESPDLVAKIVADFSRLGLVGEEANILACYLATISRKLDSPLGVVVQSTSASGKSSLTDAALELVPPEDVRSFSALTGQSLYYLGALDLSHKVLAVAEEEGAQRASYALKLLASQGYLTIASTGKDRETGRLVAEPYEVRGPVALLMTTTALDIDDELANRCLVVTVDEEVVQTEAIHAAQRRGQTLEGIMARSSRDALVALHRNVQRLIEPTVVVNPHAEELTFSTAGVRSRRDHARYLTLIQTIALLHQHQRESKSVTDASGATINYIEVDAADIALANTLMGGLVGHSLDDLPPVTRSLLGKLASWVETRAEATFTRREAREALGTSDTQMKVHLARLVDMELVLALRRSGLVTYQLAWFGEGDDGEKFLPGLSCPDSVTACSYAAGEGTNQRTQTGGGRGPVGGRSGPGRRGNGSPNAHQETPIPAPHLNGDLQRVTGANDRQQRHTPSAVGAGATSNRKGGK